MLGDGGWSKPSHKHAYDAPGGVAIIAGAETEKILHMGVRNKGCAICYRTPSGQKPKDHECCRVRYRHIEMIEYFLSGTIKG